MDGQQKKSENIDLKLKWSLALNTVFTIIEFVIGLFAGSLALIADSAHNLTDSLSLIISLFANKISRRQADVNKTFGYGRASILAALLNALILFSVAVYVFYEAIKRIQNPPAVEGNLVIIAASIGFVINGGIAFSFLKNKKDLNIKSTLLNFATDAAAQLGTVIAGFFIVITGNHIIDPLISILIGLLLIYSAWEVVKDAIDVLLEGVPKDINIAEVKKTILSVNGVKAIDDLHIWALSSQYAALSCHVLIKDTKCSLWESIKVAEAIKEKLAQKHHIEHATLETEVTEGHHDKERQIRECNYI